MKIYINNLNLGLLSNIADNLKTYKCKTETFLELYTDEGIYRIETKDIYLLTSLDKNIEIHEKYYENFTLITDTSSFSKTFVSSIQGDKHLSFQTTLDYHSINKNGQILYLIIKYYDGKPCDLYFETEKDINIEDNSIKNKIIEFLSLLN